MASQPSHYVRQPLRSGTSNNQTPINNKQQGDNPVSEEQNRNAEYSPSARLAYLFVLLSKHHIINTCKGIGDKAPLAFFFHFA
jgi:hypothetical protein